MTFLICYLKAVAIVILVLGGTVGVLTAIGYVGELIVRRYGANAGMAVAIFIALCVAAIPIAIGMCSK